MKSYKRGEILGFRNAPLILKSPNRNEISPLGAGYDHF